MTERNVTVRLRMVARDYTIGATEAERMTKRLAAAQRDLAGSSRSAGDELDRSARRAEMAGQRSGRALQYTAAGVAALGAAGGALKVLPGLLTATATAGAALPPILTGAAVSGGVLAASLAGVGKTAGEVLKSDDPFAGLGKNARALVFEIKALQPTLSGVQQGFQDRTLKNAAQDLRILATQVLPQVRGGLNALADNWGDTFDQITASVADPHFIGAFNSATRSADWLFDMLNARIPATVRTVGTLVESADPLARAFGHSLVTSLDQFNAAVDRAARSGSLEEFFARGAKGAGDFMAIAEGVLRLTGMVVTEVQKQNGSLADTRASLEAYLASGRGAADVAGIVHTLTTAYEGLQDVLGPLGAIARDALADPATADALRTMFDVLAAGSRVLQVVFGLFQGLPDVFQSTILVAIAGAVVFGKLSKALALVQGAADRAATSLGKTGKAGERAGRGLRSAAAGAGKATVALVGLQVLGDVLDQFNGAAPDVDAVGRALEDFAAKGKLGGEMTRLFGKDLEWVGGVAKDASDTWLNNLSRGIEGAVPAMQSISEWLVDASVTGNTEKMKTLDAALTEYARTTGDVTTAQEVWNRVFNASGMDMQDFAKLLPTSTAELQRLREANETGAQGFTANSERAKLLGGSFREAALAGKDLANTMDLINGKNTSALEGQIRLEQAYDDAAEVVDKYGRVTKKGTNEIDRGTKAGRESLTALIGIKDAAVAAADAEVKRTDNTAAGVPILNAARDRFIALATEMTGSAAAATALANEIFKIPDKDVKVDAKTEAAIAKLQDMGITIGKLPNGKTVLYAAKTEEGRRKLREAGFELKKLPNGKWVVVDAKTDEAKKKLREAQNLIDRLQGKTVTLTVVQKTITRDGQRVTGGTGSGTLIRAHGGVSVPYGRPIAAAVGLVRPDIYPASNPPLYQFAERETGGELFLPRRGIDMARGRALLAIAASWYGGMFMPMARGGITAAAAGLVSYAPSSSTSTRTRGSALDSTAAYIDARDALSRLNASLKENGRSFSLSTAKGRENYSTLIAAARAAEDAAQAKYAETGSVKAANAAYDAHIAALRRALAQQKVSASTIAALTRQLGRPSYDLPAPATPVGSSRNIAATEGRIRAEDALAGLVDHFSLTKPVFDIKDATGRENLTELFGYLKAAQDAAQAVLEQTGNRKTASGVYESYIGRLRAALGGAGAGKGLIDSLIAQYGKAVLAPNLAGGVYGPMALSEASLWRPGSTLYGFAERGTGGELFVPRLGDQARGERLLAIGAGWYGGRYVPAGGSGGDTTTVNNTLNVSGGQHRLTLGELQGLLRQMDARARVGRKN